MLDSRSQRVLWAVVESYIDSPDPVGSRYVTKKYEFGLSPATIRNIMADLEDLGFLTQPHTSAGRVPTDMGYRFYVENILAPPEENMARMSEQMTNRLLTAGGDVDDILQEATRLISSFSHYLGVASLPRTENSTLHKIEMMNYKDDRIVVMLFTNEGTIKHKIIPNELSLEQRDLGRISSYLSERFTGKNIKEIRSSLVREMKEQKSEFDALIERTLAIFGEGSDNAGDDVLITGFKEVVNLPDFSDIDKIKILSEAIEDKHTIVKLLDKIVDNDGVQVIIGSENRIEGLSNMSMVATTYRESNRPVGVLGIIGPTRMNYQNAIVLVDAAARCLDRMLGGNSS
ncbi:MAG: heat-inducible transcription repressor HrcA [Nitrospirota bacterium]|nr:MAG: heat-inducible transcription repressor HrcA [Nitrospirota bacterium]